MFFTDDILRQIFNESMKYAKLKGSHKFDIDMDTPKAFITRLLISEYVDLPRRHMFWKNTADEPNISVSSLMSINRFVEIMQKLHLIDNSTLVPNDKLFTKVVVHERIPFFWLPSGDKTYYGFLVTSGCLLSRKV